MGRPLSTGSGIEVKVAGAVARGPAANTSVIRVTRRRITALVGLHQHLGSEVGLRKAAAVELQRARRHRTVMDIAAAEDVVLLRHGALHGRTLQQGVEGVQRMQRPDLHGGALGERADGAHWAGQRGGAGLHEVHVVVQQWVLKSQSGVAADGGHGVDLHAALRPQESRGVVDHRRLVGVMQVRRDGREVGQRQLVARPLVPVHVLWDRIRTTHGIGIDGPVEVAVAGLRAVGHLVPSSVERTGIGLVAGHVRPWPLVKLPVATRT